MIASSTSTATSWDSYISFWHKSKDTLSFLGEVALVETHLVTENFEMDCINTQPGSTNGDKPKWDVIETTLSTMYGILLVSIYAAFQYTELVKFPSFYHWLEINGFFIYLYVISIIYFLYLLIFVLRGTNKNRNSDGPIKVVENEEVRLNCMMLLIIRSIEPNIHHANTKIIFVKFLSESW